MCGHTRMYVYAALITVPDKLSVLYIMFAIIFILLPNWVMIGIKANIHYITTTCKVLCYIIPHYSPHTL
jgi:hypothetical protein